MRLFAAIDLTDEARAAIADAQADIFASLGDRGRGLRLIRPAHMHLTLVFAGRATDAVGAAIVGAMEADIAQTPFELTLGGAGVFPQRGSPRVLWLGVLAGADSAIALQTAVTDRFATAGAELERRPFRPHLTLGRWRAPAGALAIKSLKGSVGVATVTVAGVSVYESRLSSSGPTYVRLAHCHLRCPSSLSSPRTPSDPFPSR